MRRTAQLSRTLLLFTASCCATPALHAQTTPAVSLAAVPAEKLSLAGIHNAGRVTDLLFRGAQPEPQGYDELKHLGISFVVDLRNRGRDAQREQHEVESRGMRYVSIPSDGLHGPTLEQIAAFLLLFRNNPGQKIFVHCKRGADRTGVMVAAFRMAVQHWTVEQARAEMLDFHAYHFWLPAMSHTVRDFPKDYEANAAFSVLRSPSPANASPAPAAETRSANP